MKQMKNFTIAIILLMQICAPHINAKEIVWFDGNSPVSVCIESETDLVVGTALEMFGSDMQAVTGKASTITDEPKYANIRLAQLDKTDTEQRKALKKAGVPIKELEDLIDGFNVKIDKGQILVTGTNGRGTAYGLLELSRLAGVSPWIWWGDVVPEHKDKLTISDKFSTTQGASVEYHGIFINDEDWTLRPWSYGTFEPNEFGTIGPKTNKEIFKLLMRLRANAVWPAMHTGTVAFFKDPRNKLVADSCGITIGSSHCEPLLRNNVDEWDINKRGSYNYITNKDEVNKYWAERLDEVKNSSGGNMFTIGMRGIHDGSMEGVNTMQEKFDALQTVINDQQKLIEEHIGDPKDEMQVFVPYKEVLELYEMGLEVPDYVTLMWCDDNYGYITRLSDQAEQERDGGAGVYYHLSYWGRPHDYMWLTTTQPGLIYNEMLNAYNHNARKLWIVNVHDPKVAAYDLELFLDMAWNINSIDSENVGLHLKSWLATQFGDNVAERLYPVMRKFYELCGKRHPEFMGWSQTELDKKTYNRGLSPVSNTDFSFTEFGSEADRYMDEFTALAKEVDAIEKDVPSNLKNAYFTAIKYPVAAAANNAVKMLEAQRARQFASGSTREDMFANNPQLYHSVAKSQQAYQNIRRLTEFYNNDTSGGKWKRSMNMRPRDLPSTAAPALPTLLNDEEVKYWLNNGNTPTAKDFDKDDIIAKNASDFTIKEGTIRLIDMLGHSNKAVELSKDASIVFEFSITDNIETPILSVAMIPTQPNDNGELRYSFSIDGSEPIIVNLKEPFRSERWKQNVLRGQALRNFELSSLESGNHTLTITAIDDHIVADQWCIDSKPNRKYYLIPTE